MVVVVFFSGIVAISSIVIVVVCTRSIWVLCVVTELSPGVVSIWMNWTLVCGFWASSLSLQFVLSALLLVVVIIVAIWFAIIAGVALITPVIVLVGVVTLIVASFGKRVFLFHVSDDVIKVS